MPTDHELFSAWQGGDERAGRELFRKHVSAIYRFFQTKLDQGAEDLTQRSFLSCVENRDRLREDTSFRAYLFGVARRVLLKELRTRHRTKKRIDLLAASAASLEESPSRMVAGRSEQKLLLHALRTVPIDYQIALELHYWEDLTVPEIAGVLEVAEGTIKARLSRGRKMLRKAIEDLEMSEDIKQTTLSNLENWARSLREVLARPGDDDDSADD